jgi:hypothetical protein
MHEGERTSCVLAVNSSSGDDVSHYSNAILLIVISGYCVPLFVLASVRGIDIFHRAVR